MPNLSDAVLMKIVGALLGIFLAGFYTFRFSLKAVLDYKVAREKAQAEVAKSVLDKQQEVAEAKFAQLQEADRFMKLALTEVGKGLKKTTEVTLMLKDSVDKLNSKVGQITTECVDKLGLLATRMDTIVERVEKIEIKSTVTQLPEGKVRVSTNKPFKE